MKALYIASTGMSAQERNVEVISNNIANMRTTGYKRQRAEFQDLLYQQITRAGAQTSDQGTMVPAGLEIGSGVRTVASPRVMSQGSVNMTEGELDVAVRGEGFFMIQLPDGRTAYTRDGSFERDADGQLVNSSGYPVSPGITIPGNAKGVSISSDGIVQAFLGTDSTPTQLGQLSSPASSTSPVSNRWATTSSSRPPPAAPPRWRAQYRRLRRPAAGLSRNGQRQLGHRNRRPHRRPARLRDERPRHLRRGRDDAIHQPAALRRLAMTMIRTISATLAFGLLCGTAFAAPALRAQIVVSSPIVTVGDMFEEAGALAEEPLFRAPLPGTTGTVDLAAVQAATARIGLTRFDARGLASITVSRSAALVDETVLADLIADDLRLRGILTEGMNAQTLFSQPVKPIEAADTDVPARLDSLRYLPGNGTFTARFTLAGSTSRSTSPAASISPSRCRTWRQPSPGTILRPEHIVMRAVSARQADAQGVPSMEQLMGMALTRQSREGVMLKASDVATPLTVAKNDPVTIYYRQGPLTLTVKGQAVTGAAQGRGCRSSTSCPSVSSAPSPSPPGPWKSPPTR